MKRFLVFLFLTGFALTARAESFKVLGSRAAGMGGAYVAVTGDSQSSTDSVAAYWNPASLGLHKGVDVELLAGAGVEATGGLLNSAKKISDLANRYTAIKNAERNGSFLTLQEIQAFADGIKNLNELNAEDVGLLGDVNGGLNMLGGRGAITVNNFTSFGADPAVDLNNLFLGSNAGNSGVNLTTLPASTTLSNSALATASTTLSDTIYTLATSAGVVIGTGTPTQAQAQGISNAIINYASSQGYTTAQITDAVNAISDAQPLLKTYLTGSKLDFSNNNSNVTLKGISLTEAAFSYGRNISSQNVLFKDIYWGVGLKYLYGQVGYYKEEVLKSSVSSSSKVFSDYNTNVESSSSIGVDAGLLWDLKSKLRSRIGLVGKNLNSPEFNWPSAAISDGLTGKYKISPQYRIGAALWPANWWILSCDYDLTKNKTPIDGYNSQMLGVGTEIDLLNKKSVNLALRGGVYKNVALKNPALTYTLGIGINLLHCTVDISGSESTDRVEVEDGDKIPSEARAAISIGFNF
jgi:hypothetical protein